MIGKRSSEFNVQPLGYLQQTMLLKSCLINSILLIEILYSGVLQACEKTLRIGISESWPPYIYNDGSTVHGADIAVAEYVLKQLNTCLVFVTMPSNSRRMNALEHGAVDVLLATSYNQSKEKFGWFSKPYRKEIIRIFWSASVQHSILQGSEANNTLTQLLNANLKGIYNRGSYMGPALLKLKKNHNRQLIEASTLPQRMGMLMRGRVDFTIEDQWAGLHYIQANQLNDVKLHPHVVYSNEVSLFFNRKVVLSYLSMPLIKLFCNNMHKLIIF